jgi:hypothetical protein
VFEDEWPLSVRNYCSCGSVGHANISITLAHINPFLHPELTPQVMKNYVLLCNLLGDLLNNVICCISFGSKIRLSGERYIKCTTSAKCIFVVTSIIKIFLDILSLAKSSLKK